ncbi:aldose epimerase family protein [Aquirufa sp. OSTEICH-129A]
MEINFIDSPDGRVVQLRNPATGESAEILADLGGALKSLYVSFAGKLENIIAIPQSKQFSMRDNDLYPSALLCPWVNRVRNGNYSFLGKNYQLPINEKALGNAIHGFLARRPFELGKQVCTDGFAKISLIYNYEGDYEAYPFPFVFEWEFSLGQEGILDVSMKCTNSGEGEMPFACGWHPYFQIPGTDLADYHIYFQGKSRFLSDSQMIPMKEELMEMTKGLSFRIQEIDHVFRLNPMDIHLTELVDTKQKRALFVQQSSKLFPFLVIFAPANENCVAIEPMTANTDAFNTLDGLIQLKSGDFFQGNVQIWVGNPLELTR